jgi:hypothetical protein
MIMFILMTLNFSPKIGKYLPNYLTNIANNIIVDNNYLQYINVNLIVTLIIFLVIIFLSTKLCHSIE